jgi:hypothetical protein
VAVPERAARRLDAVTTYGRGGAGARVRVFERRDRRDLRDLRELRELDATSIRTSAPPTTHDAR